jgi:hypothetical protein
LKFTIKLTIKLAIILSIFLTLSFCSKSQNENRNNTAKTKEKKEKNNSYSQVILPVTEMETAGFEYISPSYLDIFRYKDNLYLLNTRDKVLAKFTGGKFQKSVKSEKGKQPWQMIAPKSLYIDGNGNIAVYDIERAVVLTYDRDLKAIEEKKVHRRYLEIFNDGPNQYAFLRYREHLFGRLDENLHVVDTFGQAFTDMPFEEYNRYLLNKVFFPGNNEAAHTHWNQPQKQCTLTLYDLESKKIKQTLSWQQQQSLIKKNFLEDRKLYFTIFAAVIGNYYVVQNSLIRDVASPRIYSLLIFTRSGEMVYNKKFPHRLLRMQSDTEKNHVYILDENANIAGIDIHRLLEAYAITMVNTGKKSSEPENVL